MQNEKIIYTAIIKKKHTILTEFTDCSGNFSQITEGIMDEVINVLENEPSIYKAKFIYGKYIFYVLRDNKIYIITMIKPQKIKTDNDLLFYNFLLIIHEELSKKKQNIFEKPGKLRAYSLSELSPELKAKTIQFNNGEIKFNDAIVNKQKDIIKFDILNEQKFDEYKQFPILSNEQVHSDKNVISTEIELNTTDQMDKTMDSFNDDLLRSTLMSDDRKNMEDEEIPLPMKPINSTEFDAGFRQKKRKIACPIIIIIIIIILIIISILLYFFVFRK
jgi:hypothetical protein